MWVIIKKTFAGTLAGQATMFVAGSKKDLSKDQIEQLRKKIGDENVVETCAPWEEGVDVKAAKHNSFMAKVAAAIKKAESLTADCDARQKAAEKMLEELKSKIKDRDNAVAKAKKLAKSAGIDWPQVPAS